jgi:hypothetical protein
MTPRRPKRLFRASTDMRLTRRQVRHLRREIDPRSDFER